MGSRIREIIGKELRQALREPRMRVLLFLPPLLQLLIFGFAVNLDVEFSRIAWVDLDRTPVSRELLAAFEGSRYFQVVATPDRPDQVQPLLDREQVQAVISVLPGFAREIQHGGSASVQVIVNGANSNSASVVSSYAAQVVASFAGQKLARQQQEKLFIGADGIFRPALPELAIRSRVWFNPDLRSRNYYVPGVVANIITIVTLILTAMALVREKEIGTMEQLMVTPIRPIELILGKTLPFALVGLCDMVLVTGAALAVFRIPFRGQGWLLLCCSILFLMTSLGAGLFISTISHTQQQAMMASFFFVMPAFMLSGFAFPIRNMPVAVQYLTYANPVRYFIEILRGIFLKGSGVEVLWPQMAALFVYGAVVLGLSVLRFQKRLD
ncbi:MAG: ABC transporter permease [Acidobacteria bacterium]|nr:ABC transporter permease [Acidobacteriota bacterium]